MKKRIIALLLACMMLVLPMLTAADSESITSPNGGEASSTFKMGNKLAFNTTTLDGTPIDSSIIKNYDLVFVNYWAEWCGPCVSEMPSLAKLDAEYSNVLFLGAYVGSSPAAAIKKAEELGVKYESLMLDSNLYSFLPSGSVSIPRTCLFDRNGNQVDRFYIGSRSYDSWKTIIDNALSPDFPTYYDLKVVGGEAWCPSVGGEDTWIRVPAGAEIKLIPDKPKQGLYYSGYQSDDGTIRADIAYQDQWETNNSFIMPAKDMVIRFVEKEATPYTLDLSKGSVTLGEEGRDVFHSINNSSRCYQYEGDYYIDLDYDWEDDIKVTIQEGETEKDYQVTFEKLDTCAVEESSITREANFGGVRYTPITFVLKEGGETSKPVVLNGASLTLEGQITINFFVQVPEGSTAKTVKLTYAKGGTKTYTLDKGQKYYDSKNDEYKLAFPNIPAKEMTVPVTLKVYDADGKQLPLEHYKLGKLDNNEYAYCVADWAKNILGGTGKKAETVYLAKALLNYGDYAQKYFKYNTSNPANPNGYLASEMGGVSANGKNDAVIPADAKEKIGYSGASLILEGATSVRLYFTQKVEAKNASGKAYTLQQSGKEWYVEIPNIASKDLDEKYVVIVTKDGKDYRFEYSALSYANGRLTNAKAKDDIKNLCRALYLYNDAANKYFG